MKELWVYDPLIPGKVEKLIPKITEEWIGKLVDHWREWGLNKRGCFYFFLEHEETAND